ncbi:hypothetical protein [Dictyobacter formicarum]|uniref:Integrase SAM-like N-terminal domain-containing protein n=1 Tax=Dictyobacter formicarum TaxID=2778368 RepID=A0ABQ3VT97_9CHLR|nr:hypothetical protein [Dictyobacter formicarum]GHO89507.1 hypothetical protein KSZ_75130 [Dictyobacter formicarum]
MPRKSRRPIRGAGSVYQRKDGRWVGSFIIEETGKRKYLYGATQEEAYKKLQQALFDQKKGTLITKSQATMKLADYLTYWIENIHCPLTVRISTYIKHKGELKNHI